MHGGVQVQISSKQQDPMPLLPQLLQPTGYLPIPQASLQALRAIQAPLPTPWLGCRYAGTLTISQDCRARPASADTILVIVATLHGQEEDS